MHGFRAQLRQTPRRDVSPKKIYKWVRGTTGVWDLAVHGEDGFAYTPDDTAKVELGAWNKLWRPGTPQFQKIAE
eukprot:5798955-Amphidinium_carterae.3